MSLPERSRKAVRVLVVDDDPIMRELAQSKLLEAGYQVSSAENGADAWRLLAAETADLVVADLEMPVMDGFALTEAIRRDARLADVPVIVITSSDHSAAVDRAFAAGATSFVAKPVNWALFGHSVRFVLRASEDQRALKTARDEAQAGARFKDALMSMMSHELRTPLNAIIGFGQILGDVFEQQNDRLHHEYADYIIAGGRRLLSSVSDILLASDASSGGLGLNEGESAIRDIIEIARCEHEAAVAASSADVQVSLPEAELEIRCDCALVAKAVGKLIHNAVKFSEPGVKIVVGAMLMKSGAAALIVKDDGPGLDEERLAAAMQPFAQSDMSLKRAREGLGLGLPLVTAIAKAHDAVFRLESKPGAGTQAAIVFPKSRVRVAAARGETAPRRVA